MPNIHTGQINASAPSSTLVITSSDTVVSANLNRLGLVLTNISDSTIYIGLAGHEAKLNAGIALNPSGGVWVMDEYNFNNEKVQAIAHTANSILTIQEFIR